MRTPRAFGALAWAGYAAVVLAVSLPSALAISNAHDAARRRDHVTAVYVSDLLAAERLQAAATAEVIAARGYVLSGNKGLLAEYIAAHAAFDEAHEAVSERLRTAEGRDMWQTVESAAAAHRSAVEGLVAAKGGPGTTQEIERAAAEALESRHRLEAVLDRFVALKASLVGPAREKADAEFREALAVSSLALVVAIVLATAFAWLSKRMLGAIHARERASRDAAERALAARQEILGIVSHDLRSPIQAIVLRSELLRTREPSREVASHASAIAEIAGRMEKMIANLLDAARVEAGSFGIEAAETDGAAILRECAQTFAAQAQEKGITLDVRSPSTMPLRADRTRLAQALANLVGNSMKFTPDGGRVQVTGWREGADAVFSVSDTGPGIPPEHRAHIFDRFVSHGVGAHRESSGLGLYIARGIAEAHGGRIEVESETGRGTTFTLVLPRDGPTSKRTQRQRKSATPTWRRRLAT